jgi:hypothetical protein
VTVRKGSKQASSLESAIDNLPERFLDPVAEVKDGNMVGLAAYISDMTQHLQKELGGVSNTQVIDVMSTLGVAPSEWYRAVMQSGNYAKT